MAICFVFISADAKKVKEVFKKLNELSGIVELHPLLGEYDFIAKIETGEFNDLERIIIDSILSIEGVINTKKHPFSIRFTNRVDSSVSHGISRTQ